MANYISEDDIERAILEKLNNSPFNYDILRCPADAESRDNLNDGTGRNSKRQCVLPVVLTDALYRINPAIDKSIIDGIVRDLSRDFTGTDLTDTNYKNYKKIRDKIKVKVKKNGKDDFDFVQLIDFDNPENNTFTAVSQMWIQGHYIIIEDLIYSYSLMDCLLFSLNLKIVLLRLKKLIIKIY